MVVEELKKIQDKLGFIPEQEMNELSKRIDVPVYELHGVASFYPHFRLAPPPKASIHVCTDLPCHLRNSERLLDTVKQMAEGRPDIEVKACSCLGQCDGAPAVMINDSPDARQFPDDLLKLAERAMGGE